MRPRSIRLFEMLYLSAIALVAASAIYDFGALIAAAEGDLSRRGIDPTTLVIAGIAFTVFLMLALWFMVARLRIGFVRFLLIALLAWQAWPLPQALANGTSASDVVAIATIVLQAIAIIFTFTPSARAWFAGTGPDISDQV